ncbi:MAG: histidinol-phosphate aminotransferase family protein [Candidatus Omnitrophica bacterium]|nr:histidinol-phosphate aminotransferase family protein [Candidatus Omnitrophota bacterium]
MKKHFKDHIQNMKRYQTSLGRDLVHGYRLDRNERVSNLSPNVMEDLLKKFSNYIFSASPESATLYEKIAKSLNVEKDKIYITGGITEGIRILYEILTNPGDNVIVLDPTYPMFMVYAGLYQLDYRKITYKNDLTVDFDSLYRQMDQRTKIVLIPNPNLPIESSLSIEQLRSVAQECKKRDIVLVVDEAYHFFGSPTVLSLIDEFENLIVTRTFSKAYGLAGLRLGFMVSQPQNIEYFNKTRSLVESNTLSMLVAEYFLDHPELVQEHVREVKEGAAYLQTELDKLGLRWHGGNFTNGLLIFLDEPAQSKAVVSYMRERKIYIRGSFEAPYDACIRISIGPKSVMEVFMKEFTRWLSENTNIIKSYV